MSFYSLVPKPLGSVVYFVYWCVIRQQADDELETPILAGFEWDKEESWTRLIVHTKKEGAPQPKKKSKKQGQEGEEL